MSERPENQVNQTVYLENRKNLSITGAIELISFDDKTINVTTKLGKMAIRGENIKIENFNTDTGDMQIIGKIFAIIYYGENKEKGSLVKRLLR